MVHIDMLAGLVEQKDAQDAPANISIWTIFCLCVGEGGKERAKGGSIFI